VVLAAEVPGVGSAPPGTADTEMAGVGISRSAALGDVTPATESSGAMSLQLSGPYLPGYPDSTSPPINSRRVENEVESACSVTPQPPWAWRSLLLVAR
jgi:hypothetical protein